MSDIVTLYRPDSACKRNCAGCQEDAEQAMVEHGHPVEFRTVHWCTAHNSNGNGPPGNTCHYSALAQLSEWKMNPCKFVDKLVEV